MSEPFLRYSAPEIASQAAVALSSCPASLVSDCVDSLAASRAIFLQVQDNEPSNVVSATQLALCRTFREAMHVFVADSREKLIANDLHKHRIKFASDAPLVEILTTNYRAALSEVEVMRPPLTIDQVKTLHGILGSNGIVREAGQPRLHSVRVGSNREFSPFFAVVSHLGEFIDGFNQLVACMDIDPVYKAAWVLTRFIRYCTSYIIYIF
jgi:hypothetical protein